MPGIEIDLSGVYQKLSDKNMLAGQRELANVALSSMNENFVPMRDGWLRNSATVAIDGTSLIWNTPYAMRHYYAPGNWNYTTPGTGPRWDEKAKGIFMHEWLQAFTRGANL